MINDPSRYSCATLVTTSAASQSHALIRASHWPRTLPAALIGGDLLFMVLHWLHVHTGLLSSQLWSISQDRGFGEMFQYLKYTGIMLALAELFRRTRLPVLLVWIGVFGLLFVDDAMRIHERFGLGIVAWANIPDFGGLRGRDWGELIYATMGVALLTPLLVLAYLRSSPLARAISADLLLLLIALLLFAVGGDAIHRLLSETAFDTMAEFVEDGGEMLVLSVCFFYIASLWWKFRSRCAGANARS